MSLLEIKDLRVYYRIMDGEVRAVDNINLTLERGKTLGFVGESGCGKTTAAFAIMKLLPANGLIKTGQIQFDGKTIIRAPLISELTYYAGGDDWEADIERIVSERKAEALRARSSVGLDDTDLPMTDEEMALLDEVDAILKRADGSDPKAIRQELLHLLERRETGFGRARGRKQKARLEEKTLRDLRWMRISMIFQGAMNAFNPVYRVGDQVKEALLTHMDLTPEETDERVAELFDLVGLDREMMRSYPHEFSGGMKQRAMIAMSLVCNPDLIIADEPTTALDVIMQDRILAEIKELQNKLNISMMIITHDISVVAEVADNIAIMYAGEISEEGSIVSVFERPSHPYTIGLMEAFPKITGEKVRLRAIPGSLPDLVRPPSGCRFHPRCRFAKEICESESPRLVEVEPGHRAACHFAQEIYSGELA